MLANSLFHLCPSSVVVNAKEKLVVVLHVVEENPRAHLQALIPIRNIYYLRCIYIYPCCCGYQGAREHSMLSAANIIS